MLLAQKSYVEGSLALCLFAARLIDEHQAAQDNIVQFCLISSPRWLNLSLLPNGKPMIWPFRSCGAGYTREYPVEQCYRDNRLNPIHEGTYGIQSLDLLGRKLRHNGKGLNLLMQRIQKTLSEIHEPKLVELADIFKQHLATVQKTTHILGQALHQGKVSEALANSGLYLDMMGKTILSWLWLKMANQAQLKFGTSSQAEDQTFLAGKIQAAQYFIRWELPEIKHQAKLLMNLDDTCLNMRADWF